MHELRVAPIDGPVRATRQIERRRVNPMNTGLSCWVNCNPEYDFGL